MKEIAAAILIALLWCELYFVLALATALDTAPLL